MTSSPHADRDALARRIYATLRSKKELNRRRTIAYWCAEEDGCLLLDIVRTQHGLLVYHPSYRMSPGKNERESTAEGRAKHARDGANHWPEQTYFDEAAGREHFTVRCRHMPDTNITRERLAEDIAAGRTGVVLKR